MYGCLHPILMNKQSLFEPAINTFDDPLTRYEIEPRHVRLLPAFLLQLQCFPTVKSYRHKNGDPLGGAENGTCGHFGF